jgi:hypothetical protein
LSKAPSGEKALLVERVEDPAVRLPRVPFKSWTWLIPGMIAADLAALWIWAIRPPRVYTHWLGLVGLPDEAPIRRLLAWARWENGPRTLSGCVYLFEAGELFFGAVLVLALFLLITMLLARRSETRLWRGMSAPIIVARVVAVRYRVRAALAAIAILGLYLGWEIHGWRTWWMRSFYLQRAGIATVRENGNRALLQSKREQLAKLMETDLSQLSELSAPGFYRSKAAHAADRRVSRDRLNREIRYVSAAIAACAERRSKYERAAANPWGPVEPDKPVPAPEPEPGDLMGSRDYTRALAACDALARIYPDLVDAHSRAAWLRATCPDSSFRDGKLAVASAKRACELTDWQDIGELSVLAAACAEAGDFAQAVKWQQKVVGLATAPWYSQVCRDRLALYMAGKPYRQE